MRRFVRRPSPAMIVALVALVAATAGNAIADQVDAVVAALKTNSVTSKTVKNGSLLAKDFKKSELKKLTGKAGATGATGAAGAAGPQGPAGTPNGYTKTEADAAFLGKTAKSADADKLDGVDGSSFVTGGGSQNFGSLLLSAGDTNKTLLTIPSIGVLKVGCTGVSEAMDLTVENDQSSTIRMSYAWTKDATTPEIDGRQIAAAGSFPFNLATTDSQLVFQFTKSSLFSTSAASVLVTAITNPVSDPNKCRFQAQVQTGSSGFNFVIFNPVLTP